MHWQVDMGPSRARQINHILATQSKGITYRQLIKWLLMNCSRFKAFFKITIPNYVEKVDPSDHAAGLELLACGLLDFVFCLL